MLVYSGKPCSSDRYVIDNSVREERDHPTLDGGEYDHDACGLLGDDAAVSPHLGDEGPAFCLSEKISLGPADADTLWSRKMCDILFWTAERRNESGRSDCFYLVINLLSQYP